MTQLETISIPAQAPPAVQIYPSTIHCLSTHLTFGATCFVTDNNIWLTVVSFPSRTPAPSLSWTLLYRWSKAFSQLQDGFQWTSRGAGIAYKRWDSGLQWSEYLVLGKHHRSLSVAIVRSRSGRQARASLWCGGIGYRWLSRPDPPCLGN